MSDYFAAALDRNQIEMPTRALDVPDLCLTDRARRLDPVPPIVQFHAQILRLRDPIQGAVMPEFIRVRFRDSGTEQSIPKPPAIDHDAYEVLAEDAVDHNLRVLDPVIPSAPSLEDRTKDWLLDEIARRHQGRDEADQIPTQGNKPDLIKAIEADDNKGSDL